jgi:hypothetical protein
MKFRFGVNLGDLTVDSEQTLRRRRQRPPRASRVSPTRAASVSPAPSTDTSVISSLWATRTGEQAIKKSLSWCESTAARRRRNYDEEDATNPT